MLSLMVEQTGALLHKDHTQLLRCLKHGSVILASARSGNVLDTRARRTEDIVDKGELNDLRLAFNDQTTKKENRTTTYKCI